MRIALALIFCLSCERFTTWNTPKGGDFVLSTPQGKLDTSQLRGKTLFIFFGFLNCPNVCPTTTREMNRMMKLLTQKDRQRFVPIFISVDPERDTLAALKEHFASYDPAFVAATGTPEELHKALGLFGGDFQIVKGKTPDETFVDHTSSIFVINRKGEWVNSLPYDTNARDLRDALYISGRLPPYWSDEARDARMEVLGENTECDLSQGPCDWRTTKGRYEVEVSPRPVKHLEKTKLIVRSKDKKLVPIVGDLIGVELAMGLIRPKLTKVSDTEWVSSFRLPSCELRNMHWKLRLLLQDSKKENYEIKFGFSSINEFPTEPKM
ncbi:MAG: SCO family protein [Bacteriovoracaceae bacterium]